MTQPKQTAIAERNLNSLQGNNRLKPTHGLPVRDPKQPAITKRNLNSLQGKQHV